jgi:hypothetical protein
MVYEENGPNITLIEDGMPILDSKDFCPRCSVEFLKEVERQRLELRVYNRLVKSFA